MTLWQAVILGIIQGASEFLPISSSGHLVIFQKLLGVQASDIYLEVALHFGTLIAVVVYFRKDLVAVVKGVLKHLFGRDKSAHAEHFRLFLCLVIGSLPVGIGGLLLKDFFESTFESTAITGVMLLITAVILLSSGLVRVGERKVNMWRSLVIGIAQLAAVMPGISRSGSTIAAALFLGVEPIRAARFSFLLSVPAVAAAFALKMRDLLAAPIEMSTIETYGLGALVAFAVGLMAIHYLLKLIAANRFFLFGFWCLLAGAATLLFI